MGALIATGELGGPILNAFRDEGLFIKMAFFIHGYSLGEDGTLRCTLAEDFEGSTTREDIRCLTMEDIQSRRETMKLELGHAARKVDIKLLNVEGVMSQRQPEGDLYEDAGCGYEWFKVLNLM